MMGLAKSARESSRMKQSIQIGLGSFIKVLGASLMVATQCITVTPGINGQTRKLPVVDLPSLAGKSMGDIYQQFKSSKKKCREVDNELLARARPGAPSFDDHCYFKMDNGRLSVGSYQGRAVGFLYIFGRNAPIEPEEALQLVGINVNGAKPREDGYEFIWSGTFNERNWKEIRVIQSFKDKKNRRCRTVRAFLAE
jgi:hypothetical protein